jgi:hypothetical protein
MVEAMKAKRRIPSSSLEAPIPLAYIGVKAVVVEEMANWRRIPRAVTVSSLGFRPNIRKFLNETEETF